MKRALISVHDKTGLKAMASGLANAGWELISTGKTAEYLQGIGLPVTAAADITGFPEILGGRVKTLHPRIFAGILAKDEPDQLQDMASVGAEPIDLVVCSLYPFAATVAEQSSDEAACVEMIDIGGPAMIRAAAKNFGRTTVLCRQEDYPWVLEKLTAEQLTLADRRRLAAIAFAHTAAYDSMIAAYLSRETFPAQLTFAVEKVQCLRYGENPHQNAAYYRDAGSRQGLAAAQQLQGKELSFNNINDADAAWQLAAAFDQPCAVAVKHTNPCGAALGSDVSDAYQKAHAADPVSIFGGIVAVNRPLDGSAARAMLETFLEVIIAPEFTPEALECFAAKKNLRLLQAPSSFEPGWDMKRVVGGLLLQEYDRMPPDPAAWQLAAGPQVGDEQWQDLMFAWQCVKHVKSNAIVVCRNQQLIGVGAGQMNRVQSVELAVKQAGSRCLGAVIASDAFFPFADSIEIAAAAGIQAIVEPGGSKRDADVIAACEHHGISLYFTDIRHFRH